MTIVECSDADYPIGLTRLHDPPPCLWVDGVLDVLAAPAVAIVGARSASHAALTMAGELGRDLAEAGLVVVSGLARGVDAAAHRGALRAGRTMAVLGTGIDLTYPREHAELARRIVQQGARVTQFPPGTPPLRHHFPLRNRVVAALTAGVVVVEAGEMSGALITAHAALDLGKEVMVVPGLALAGRNRGGHGLIKDGAALVEQARDVLDVLSSAGAIPRSACRTRLPDVPALPALVSRWRRGEELQIIDLQSVVNVDLDVLLRQLTEWELAGEVARTPSGGFVRL